MNVRKKLKKDRNLKKVTKPEKGRSKKGRNLIKKGKISES